MMHVLILLLGLAVGSFAQSDGDLQLVGNSGNNHEGDIQMYKNGQWNSVCDSIWDSIDSYVACKQLGFTDGAPTSDSMYSGGLTGQQLTNFGCLDDEANLIDCDHDGPAASNCDASNLAGVKCTGGGCSPSNSKK